MRPLLRSIALYARARRVTTDLDVDVEPYAGLRWRVGLRFESAVRARGITMMASEIALVRALDDLDFFLASPSRRRELEALRSRKEHDAY